MRRLEQACQVAPLQPQLALAVACGRPNEAGADPCAPDGGNAAVHRSHGNAPTPRCNTPPGTAPVPARAGLGGARSARGAPARGVHRFARQVHRVRPPVHRVRHPARQPRVGSPGRQAGSGRFGAGAASGRVVGAVRGLPLPVPGGSWAHPEAPGQDADGRRVDLTCDLADQLHGSLAWPPIPPRRGPCAWWPPARCSDAPPKRPWPPRARRWRGRGPACPGPVGRGPPRGPGRSPRRPARWAR